MRTLKEQQAKAWILAPEYAEEIKQNSQARWYYRRGFSRWYFLYKEEINGWDWRNTLQSREEFEAMNDKNHFGEVMRFDANKIPNEDLANSRGFVNDDDVGDRNDKWTPEVGQKAKALRVYEVEIKGQDGEIFICKHRDIDGISDYKGYTAHQLEPIQTEADKQRDEQIEKMCQSMPSKPRADSISYEHKKFIASALYDKGCRVIASDEYVVKTPTEKQIEITKKLLIDNHFAEDDTAASFIVALVQRELGIGECDE